MASHLRANGVDIDGGEGALTLGPWLELDPATEQFTEQRRRDRAPLPQSSASRSPCPISNATRWPRPAEKSEHEKRHPLAGGLVRRVSRGVHARLPRHLQRLRLLAPQRPARLLVHLGRRMGTLSLRRQSDQSRDDTFGCRTAHDRTRRQETKRHLKYAPVIFTGVQARAVGQGFSSLSKRLAIKSRVRNSARSRPRRRRGAPQQSTLWSSVISSASATIAVRRSRLHPFQQLYEAEDRFQLLGREVLEGLSGHACGRRTRDPLRRRQSH